MSQRWIVMLLACLAVGAAGVLGYSSLPRPAAGEQRLASADAGSEPREAVGAPAAESRPALAEAATRADELAEAQANATEEPPGMERVSYAIGHNLGRSFREQEVEIDVDALLAGVRAGLGEQEPRMDEQEIEQVLTAFSYQMQQRRIEQREAEAQRQLERGQAFLEENRDAEGVMETASGLQYKVIEPGEGDSPGPTDTVVVHYTGRFIDGETFDNSRERGQPVRIPLDQVIPGWTEGMQLMREGGRYQLFIPPELAYGEEGRGDAMPPNATLIFDIELLEVEAAAE